MARPRTLEYRPPDPEVLQRAREKRFKEKKMWDILREVSVLSVNDLKSRDVSCDVAFVHGQTEISPCVSGPHSAPHVIPLEGCGPRISGPHCDAIVWS